MSRSNPALLKDMLSLKRLWAREGALICSEACSAARLGYPLEPYCEALKKLDARYEEALRERRRLDEKGGPAEAEPPNR